MKAETSQTQDYRSEIDGLRAFAVLSVIAFHAFPNLFEGGFVGVDIFFVISGFLITSHIFESLDREQFSLINFFQRRIRRIFPALIVVLIATLVFGWVSLLGEELSQLGKHIASGAFFIINFILVNESGYFDTIAETKPLLHLWSLAVEEQFYIIWPLILWISWKLKFNLLIVTILIGAFSFYLNLNFVKTYPTEIFFLSIGRFWELLSGSFLAWLVLYRSDFFFKIKLSFDKFILKALNTRYKISHDFIALNALSFVGISLLMYGVIFINESLSFPSYWALIPVTGTMLVIASGSRAVINRIFLMNPVAVWFGLISYPLYLWHWPVLSYLQIIEGEFPHRDARILAVIISIILAWLTFKFIEAPIRFGSLKKKVNSFFIALTLFSIGAFAYFLSESNISKSRTYENLLFDRNSFKFAIGNSLQWFQGKDNWLFLGNTHNKTIQKLLLDDKPNSTQINEINLPIKNLADTASDFGTKVALLVGPNKSSIYPEFLPEKLNPSKEKYINFFMRDLNNFPNLILHNPTPELIESKSKEGKLYFKTGTHYNNKGAFLSFIGLMKKLNIEHPEVSFKLEKSKNDDNDLDLIGISGLEDFPIPLDENWTFIFENSNFELSFFDLPRENATPFGKQEIVVNSNPVSNEKVWVIGDSFTNRLRPFLNRTFSEVHYIGHLDDKLNQAPSLLTDSQDKPDLIILVKVERSF